MELLMAAIMSVVLPQSATAHEGHDVKPLKELIEELKASSDTAKKNEYLHLLRHSEPQTSKEKDQVIDLIEDDDAAIKCVAMEVMGGQKEKKAVRNIITNLRDKDSEVKITAAMMLGEIGDERALDAMTEDYELMVLEFGQCPAAKIGAAALPKLAGLASKKSLVGLLPKQDKKDRRSRKAAVCISQIRDEKAVPDLMKMLKDNDDDVRVAAVGALAGMNAKQAEPEFEKMLKDKNFLVRGMVIRQLLESNRRVYLSTAIAMMDADGSASVVSGILGKLGESKDASLVPKLESVLKRGGEVGRAASVALRQITGKVYKYPKDSWIEGEELRRMRFINDEVLRFRVSQEKNEKERGWIIKNHGVEYYNWLVQNYYNWESEKKALSKQLGLHHSEGYLLDYSGVDDLLNELKRDSAKYDWRAIKPIDNRR